MKWHPEITIDLVKQRKMAEKRRMNEKKRKGKWKYNELKRYELMYACSTRKAFETNEIESSRNHRYRKTKTNGRGKEG